MFWENILPTIITSGIVVALIEWLRFRRRDTAEAINAEADADVKVADNAMKYAEQLEIKITKLEEKVDRCEYRIGLFQKAINCSYRCSRVDDPEKDCPVLLHLFTFDNGNNQ